MNKTLMNIFIASIAANGLSFVAITTMAKKLSEYEAWAKRTHTWGEMMNKIIMSHYRNGGEFLIEHELDEELEAYLLMARNGLG